MIAVLMTDGRPTMGAVDSSDIIARFSRQNAGEISVFTVGAGDRVNAFLLDLLGHNNRGGSWILPLREQIPDAVKRAAANCRGPCWRISPIASPAIPPPKSIPPR
jgi:hypothetical protein